METREQMLAWLALEGWEIVASNQTSAMAIRKAGEGSIGVLGSGRTYTSCCDWSRIPRGEQYATLEQLRCFIKAVETKPDQ